MDDGQRVIVCGNDIRIWNMITGEQKGPVIDVGAEVIGAILSQDETRLSFGRTITSISGTCGLMKRLHQRCCIRMSRV